MKTFLRRLLFVFLGLIGLAVLFYAEEDLRGWLAWKNCKHTFAAKGVVLDWNAYIPPPVPDDQNFALTPIVASCYSSFLDKNGHRIEPPNTNVANHLEMKVYSDLKQSPTNGLGNWQTGTKTDLKTWQEYFRSSVNTNDHPGATNEFPVASEPQLPAADILLALSKYDSVIEELRQASRLPYSRFPINYGLDFQLPHLGSLRRCSQVLQLRSLAELQNGQGEKALADVKLLLYLANSIHTEPFIISHLVRISILQMALQPVYEGLAEHKWSEAQIAVIESELEKFDLPADYQFSMRAEIAARVAMISYLGSFSEFHNQFYWSDDDDMSSVCTRIVQAAKFYMMPRGWFYQNDMVAAKISQHILLTDAEIQQHIIPPEIDRNWSDAMKTEYGKHNPYNFIAEMVLFSSDTFAQKMAFAQTSLDLAQITCALERYHLAHGEYPGTLDALSPQFIERLPHDIIGGAPLIYRPTADGKFLLYSIGWNEKDDGGKSGGTDFTKGDWVWKN